MKILVTGDHRHHEFADCLAWLREHGNVLTVANPDAAAWAARWDWPPQVIVIAQPRPGCLAASAIELIHHAAPLARLVALLGSLCEGETRSGRPWPGGIRLFWHEFVPRMSNWLAGGGEPEGWRLPRTATGAERQAARPPGEPFRLAEPVGIYTASAISYEGLSAAMSAARAATIWLSPRRPPRVDGLRSIVWDAERLDEQTMTEFEQFRLQNERVRPIVLASFVRPEDRGRFLAAGAAAVFVKPFQVDDLLRELASHGQKVKNRRAA